MIEDIKFAELTIGQQASMSKTISEHDVYTYAGITGDFNPVHINAEFAKNSMFGERIAHGMISAGLISAVIGTSLPGANTIYMGQDLSFRAPVKFGDTITATVEVVEKIEGKNRIILKTTVTNQTGKVVTEGKATVLKK